MPPTRPNTAAPANDPRGQPIAARTRDWANDVGYDVGAPGPDRAADRRLRRRDRAALQIDALRRSLPRPAAAPALDPDFDGPIVLKRGLKGGRDKKTALVDIDGRTFVVKGGSEFAADHVAASEFIGRLGLPGVRAPAAKLLSDDQKAKLIAALSTGDGHAQQLAASLGIQGVEGRNGGQISEVVEGVQLAAIFPAKHHAEGEEMALKLLKEVKDLDPDTAWPIAIGELEAYCARIPNLKRHAEAIRKLADASDDAARRQAIAWLRDNVVRAQAEALTDVLDDIRLGDAGAAHGRMTARRDARPGQQQELSQFAASDEGVEAFAGIAIADLITGMHDRVLSAWNGGNFLFDAKTKTLGCVDNAKSGTSGLTAEGNDAWKTFADKQIAGSATLDEALYKRLYEEHEGSENHADAIGKHVRFDGKRQAAVKAGIRQVVLKALAQVDDAQVHGKAAVERVAYLKARLALEDVFRLEPKLAAPPDLPKLSSTDKTGRAVSGLVAGRKIRDETQKIKDDLRNGVLSAADAKTRLLALQQKQQSLTTDRRSAKIELLITAAQLRAALVQKQGELPALAKSSPAGLWTAETAKALVTPVRTAVEAWLAAVSKDAKTTAQLSQAWTQFLAVVHSA